MLGKPRIGFYSPYLPLAQKAALRQLEDGLAQERPEQADQAMRTFLGMSFVLTREAVLRSFPEFDLAALETIRDDESDRWGPLAQFLWNGDNLSPFARRLLAWQQSDLVYDEASPMGVVELNNYLVACVDFYESLRSERQAPLPTEQGLASGEILLQGLEPLSDLPRFLDLGGEIEPEDGEETALEQLRDSPEMEAPLAPSEHLPPSGSPPEPKGFGVLDVKVAPADSGLVGGRQAKPDVEEAFLVQQKKLPPEVDREDGLEAVEMSAAPFSPLEKRSHLIVKKKYFGYGKNSDGVMGFCGQLTLSRFDDQSLNASLECSNPLLFLTSTRLAGKTPTVTYWMPPAAFPQPSGHLSIKTPEQSKVLSVGSLFPQSRTDFMTSRQVLLLLLAPSLLGLFYFTFVYLLSASRIVDQVKTIFPDAYAAALSGSAAIDFRAEGVGLYQLEVVPASESLQLIWAALIWFCPLIATKFFRHLSASRKRSFGGALAAALLLPSLGLLAVWKAQRASFPLFDQADFGPLDLRNFLPWSVPLNVAIALYLFLSVHGVWDRKVASRELRLALPIGLAAMYLLTCFILIFGRSWLG